jgi:cyclase
VAEQAIPSWQTEWKQVGDGAYAFVQESGAWGISNAGLLVGEDSALVVDALFVPRMTRAFLQHIAETTSLPVKQLVNTHHHGDHTYGNAFFKDAAQFCHVNCREQLEEWGRDTARMQRLLPWWAEELRDVRIVFPETTFEDRLVFYQGDRRIEAVYVGGPAHTRGDVLVYVPDQKLLYAGDIAFLYVTPLAFEGHVSNWIDVCDRVLSMDVETIVPGHGPVGTKRDLEIMRDYLALLRDAARRGFERGQSPLECAREVKLGIYTQWADGERTVATMHRLYAELRGEGAGPLDLPAVFADMRQWAGPHANPFC